MTDHSRSLFAVETKTCDACSVIAPGSVRCDATKALEWYVTAATILSDSVTDAPAPLRSGNDANDNPTYLDAVAGTCLLEAACKDKGAFINVEVNGEIVVRQKSYERTHVDLLPSPLSSALAGTPQCLVCFDAGALKCTSQFEGASTSWCVPCLCHSRYITETSTHSWFAVDPHLAESRLSFALVVV